MSYASLIARSERWSGGVLSMKLRLWVTGVSWISIMFGLGCGESSESSPGHGPTGAQSGTTRAATASGTGGASSTGAAASTGQQDPTRDEPCGALTHAQAVAIVTTNTNSVLRHGSDSAAFVELSLVLPRILGGSADPITYKQDFDDAIADMVTRIENNLLHPDNLVEERNETVTYALDPDVTCEQPEPDPEDPLAEEEALAEYEDCRQSLIDTPMGLEVTRVACDSGDNAVIRVLVGEEPVNPLTLHVLTTELTAHVDLANAAEVLRASGTLEEGAEISQDTTGELSLSLQALSGGAARLAASILAPIHLGLSDDQGSAALTIGETGTALDLVSTPADQTITGAIDLGQLSYAMPFTSFIDGFFVRETVENNPELVTLTVSGIDSTVAFDGVSDTLELRGLGIGDASSTATLDNDTLVKVDVNESASRHFHLKATSSASEPLRLELEPGFDLSIEYSMAAVAPLITDLQTFAHDDTLRIQLSGEQPSAVLYENAEGYVSLLDDMTGTLLGIKSGTLSMTSRTITQDSVTVPTGQCLVRLQENQKTHEFLGELTSQSCP